MTLHSGKRDKMTGGVEKSTGACRQPGRARRSAAERGGVGAACNCAALLLLPSRRPQNAPCVSGGAPAGGSPLARWVEVAKGVDKEAAASVAAAAAVVAAAAAAGLTAGKAGTVPGQQASKPEALWSRGTVEVDGRVGGGMVYLHACQGWPFFRASMRGRSLWKVGQRVGEPCNRALQDASADTAHPACHLARRPCAAAGQLLVSMPPCLPRTTACAPEQGRCLHPQQPSRPGPGGAGAAKPAPVPVFTRQGEGQLPRSRRTPGMAQKESTLGHLARTG